MLGYTRGLSLFLRTPESSLTVLYLTGPRAARPARADALRSEEGGGTPPDPLRGTYPRAQAQGPGARG